MERVRHEIIDNEYELFCDNCNHSVDKCEDYYTAYDVDFEEYIYCCKCISEQYLIFQFKNKNEDYNLLFYNIDTEYSPCDCSKCGYKNYTLKYVKQKSFIERFYFLCGDKGEMSMVKKEQPRPMLKFYDIDTRKKSITCGHCVNFI